MSKPLKLLVWIAAGLGLFVAYWGWYMLGLNNAQEVFIVPHNFRGIVYILFDQPEGAPTEYDWLKRVYRIPSSGLLRTRFSLQEGLMRLPEFYWDSAGQRQLLHYQVPNGRRIPLGAYVSAIETGAGGCVVDKQGNVKEQIAYKSFIVSDERNVEKFYQQLSDDTKAPPELTCTVTLTDKDSVQAY